MSDVLSEIDSASTHIVETDSVLVDWRGMPSPLGDNNRNYSLHTIAFRRTHNRELIKDANGNMVHPNPTPTEELDLYPGLNAVDPIVWKIIKPTIPHLLKPYKRTVNIIKDETAEVKITTASSESALMETKQIREEALLVECGTFNSMSPEKAASLISRCVNEKLLERFEQRYGDSEDVRDAIETQREKLNQAVVKH